MTKNLMQRKILVTRPVQHAVTLCDMITAHNGVAINLPLFSIESLVDGLMLQKLNEELQSCDLIIITSRNAVNELAALEPIDTRNNQIWACVGPATEQEIWRLGISNTLVPQNGVFNSASLIQELKSRGIFEQQKRVLVLTGAEGNEGLGASLSQLGATAIILNLYRRVMPVATDGLAQILKQTHVDIMLITCVTSLMHLSQFLVNESRFWAIPLMALSKRITKKALEMGFINVYTSKGVTDAQVIESLIAWHNNELQNELELLGNCNPCQELTE